MNKELEHKVKWFIQHDSLCADKFDFVVRISGNSIRYSQLEREFKDYLDEMINSGSDIMNENLRIHLFVFLVTSGYPMESQSF